jgi:hypothetical protein
LRAHLVEMAAGMCSGAGGLLALVMPSPRAWVALAYRQAYGVNVEVGEDEADSASVYMADFLRAFGEVRLDALLLQEAAEDPPATTEELRACQAIYGVAVNYKWDVGLRLPKSATLLGPAPNDLAFMVAADIVLDSVPHGSVLADNFWNGADRPALRGADFHFGEIPERAIPERVLERLASLS